MRSKHFLLIRNTANVPAFVIIASLITDNAALGT